MSARSEAFGARLERALQQHGPLCVGIDPHPTLLTEWGLSRDAAGAESFGLAVVEAAGGRVAVVKPQVAFYERYGSAGIAALERVMAAARERGLLVIADAKRGDIGSTMAGYADAWLRPGAPLEADAVTLSPYLGFGSLAPAVELAEQHGKGVFVLAATSNPEAFTQQQSGRPSIAARIASAAISHNAEHHPEAFGSVGLVIGATVQLAEYGIDPVALRGTPILAPGFGAQGATAKELPLRFGAAARGVLVSQSRSILEAGPAGLVVAIERERAAIAQVLP